MHMVDNAVIMAAGTASRFAPLSYEMPKALIPVRGEVLIERQIRQLQEAGVPEIYIVTGYKAEMFSYLEEKFGVHLVHNPDYLTRNNNASIYAVKDILKNTYICSSDNYFHKNPFEREVSDCYYAAVYAEGPTKEWCMDCDADGMIRNVTVGGADAWYMLGHTFWDEAFSKKFVEILEAEYDLPETANLLWESIYRKHFDELSMKIRKYEEDVIFEFDTLDELREFDHSYIKDTRSAILKEVAERLHTAEEELWEIASYKDDTNEAAGFTFLHGIDRYRYAYKDGSLILIKAERAIVKKDVSLVKKLILKVLGTDEYIEFTRMGGLTNHTYRVVLPNKEEYVVRIPGDGTEELIVRSDEKVSTQLACELGVDAELLYFGEKGEKVTRYIPNAVTMNAELLHEPKHIKQIADIFKKIHTCGADTKVPFEVFEMASGYEKIIRDKSVPMFEDYAEIKEEVMSIKAEIDAAIPVQKVPCHNDPLCENWIEGDGRMYLIDWEYAGMNDGMWDLADVSIEAGYDDVCDRLLLESYLGKAPDVMEEKHFLASKIYVDYLWTLWAKARVPYDGQPMEDWAVERYTRLKGFVQQYKEL